MMPRRHGRRDPIRAFVIVVAALAGCGTGKPPKLASIPGPAASSPANSPIVLVAPLGASAVSEIAWGGSFAPRVVAVRFADGRFSVHRTGVPRTRIDSVGDGSAARAIAVVGADRVATGDSLGIALWDTSHAPARPIHRCECGSVASLVAIEGEGREPALIAGCADGRIVRLRIVRGERLEVVETADPGGPPSGILRLQSLAGRFEFIAIAVDGSARSLHVNLAGESTPLGHARMFASVAGGVLRARLLDGPRVEVFAAGETPARGRFFPSRPVHSLAFAGSGSTLVLGADHSLWVAPLDRDGQVLLRRVRVVDGLPGTVVVASEPGGARVAIGDGSGRVELIDEANLLARGEPMSLDDAPEWAFRPMLRFDRPRSGRCDPRVEAARRRLDRGDDIGTDLRELEANEAIDRGSLAEVKSLAASADSRSGGMTSAVSRKLAEAAALFAKAGQPDREADMEFSLGAMLARPIDASAGGRDPRSSREAIGALRRAAALYRQASPPLDRQACLCDALRAWVLLDLADVSGAARAFSRVADAARVDSVLARVAEIDRIAAAIAAARRDWPGSAAADSLVLKRLAREERPELSREASLSRAGALAAIGDWVAAAATLEVDRPTDAEWTIRRAVCRRTAKLDPGSRPSNAEDDPIAAHLRAIASEGSPSDRLADLTVAALGHRLAGREDLALEAELARAECLERIGKAVEATSGYAAAARGIAALGSDPARRASRPILDEGRRAARGLARCELAAGRPLRALVALEVADLPAWSVEPGAALGLAAAEFPLAEALREARARLHALGGPGASPEADSAALDAHRARTGLAGQSRGPQAAEAASTVFGLADDEAILVFASIGPRSVLAVFVHGKAEPAALALAIRPDDLAREIAAWRVGIGDGGRPIAAENAATPTAILGLAAEPDPPSAKPTAAPTNLIAGGLRDLLIGSFAAKLVDLKRLYVVPGAGLAAMPLEVLGRADRLGENISVRSLPRASLLPVSRDEAKADRPSERSAMLISPDGGDPARAWAAAARASGWTAAGLLGEQARPDRVLGDPLARDRVVHIVSDAILDPARSMSGSSELCLRPSPWPAFVEGRVSSRDLAHVPLRAQVLVLEVHDSRGATAEGLLDLANAGLSTGADGVLLTLWKHPEPSSRLFFSIFYQAIGSGRSTPEAVSSARSAVALDPRFRDPVHWAGYAYYGP